MSKKETYQGLLTNPLWIAKRNEVLSRDNNTCQLCGARDKYLHVHHKFYIPSRKPWDYTNNCLITLCEDCHSHIHEFFVSEMDGVVVGDVYGRFHSDYHNTGVVYAIDKQEKLVYILESDDGVTENECYNEVVKIDVFKEWYRKEEKREDWNYLFPRWFANSADNKNAPALYKLNFVEIIATNEVLMQILNHTFDD